MSMAFEGSLLSRVEAFTLAVVLITACVTDLRTRRIPNALVATGALAGVGFAVLDAGFGGAMRALGGMMIGLAMWMPFWLLHMMGGGDVKLFAAGAAWLGPVGAVEAGMIAGLCGGLLSLLYLAQRHGLRHTLFRLVHGVQHPLLLREPTQSVWDRRMPYALAMAAGLAGAARWPGLFL